jgi:predicted amidohydrolase
MKTRWLPLVGIILCLITLPSRAAYTSRGDTPPRKIVIGTALVEFAGPLKQRLQLAGGLIDDAARAAAGKYSGSGLDLMVFPEFAFANDAGATAAETAVPLDGPVLDFLGAKAREHHTWIVAPMTLRESDRLSNAAVLINRSGTVTGIYRKTHPIADNRGVFEGGVTPGTSYPVFDTDFGKIGILICWDMNYDEAWDAFAAAGADLVALPSASPQTLRPMSQALRHHYYVVTSTPKDNASIFDPIGRSVAQVSVKPGVVVHQVDLAFAILHWSETLHNGQALTDRFGRMAGYLYSDREDTGVFWSNDPQKSIGSMIRDLGLREMPVQIDAMDQAAKKFNAISKEARSREK